MRCVNNTAQSNGRNDVHIHIWIHRVTTGGLPAELGKLTEVSKVDFSCNLLGGELGCFGCGGGGGCGDGGGGGDSEDDGDVMEVVVVVVVIWG